MKRTLFVGLLIAIALTACAGSTSADIQGQWRLVSYGSASDPSASLRTGLEPAAPGVETSIEFKDGTMTWNVGCNGFGWDYKVKGYKIEFGPVMSTMMYCEAIAEQEMGTLTVLQETTVFVLDGNTLTITSGDGNSVIVLERK